MALKGGRVEGIIVIPTGGWAMDVVGTASGTATVPAGSYFLSSGVSGGNSLVAAVKAAIEAVTSDTHTVTIADGEGDVSGRCTIDSDIGIGSFEITWTDTELRDVLGFEADGDLSGALTYTSTDHVKMAWLPGTKRISEYGPSDLGRAISNVRQQRTGDGNIKSIGGKVRREQSVQWRGVPYKRMRVAGEGAGQANMSLEQFWLDSIQAQQSGATLGGLMRYYWDADADATYYEFYLQGELPQRFEPTMTSAGFTSYWDITLDMSRAA
jgi:hypothetical protein